MAIMDTKKTYYWQFDGSETVHCAEGWRLESAIMETRHRLGLPVWQPYKILKNYEPVNTNPTIDTNSSSISDSNEPVMVRKSTRKTKTKLEATELQSVPQLLAEPNPLDLVPTFLRDKFTSGLSHTVSDSDSK